MTYIAYPDNLSYGGARTLNPLDPKPSKNDILVPKFDGDLQKQTQYFQYRTYLNNRLTRAQADRDTTHAEFSGKTYLSQFEQNEKDANTYLEPIKNSAESQLSTGTIEAKLVSLMSHVNNLNLLPEVLAYDRDNKSLNELGNAFTDIITVTSEHDGGDDGGDKEKKMLRQLELLKQGTVFVQEGWLTRYETKKVLNNKKYKGEFSDFAGYTEKLTKVYEGCARDVLYGPNVYLGDITKFSMNDQPFVFTVEQIHYDIAKTMFGHFEMFKYVTPGVQDATSNSTISVGGRTVYDAKWRLTNVREDQVEVIRYQDPTRDEYMIEINGILVLPIGYPLSAVTPGGRFNIAKQTLYVINAQFAYGKGFVASGAIHELAKALDRMIRLFELKTRKSINPSYINTTNKAIPASVLNPGNIVMGIAPNALQAIGNEGQGVTSNEFQIFKELQEEINNSTVSSVFQGQQAKSGTTATEIIEVQRQARITLGLIVSAATLLEVKLGYLRLWNIISNWMEPVGSYADGSKRHRNITRKMMIDGVGEGERRVIPIDGKLPSVEAIRMLSLEDEQNAGYPVRRIYLSPKALREAEINWYVRVQPKEEETSSYFKLLFREMVGDALTLMQLGATPNVDGLVDEFSTIYNKDRSKIFSSQNPMQDLQVDPGKIAGDKAAGNNINTQGVSQPVRGTQGIQGL